MVGHPPITREDTTNDDLPDKDAARDFYARYEAKEVLGRGISSTVRRVIEKETGLEFGAKIMDVSSQVEEFHGMSLKEATLREINILRQVSGHPHIIHLHEYFESSSYIFLVFELCKNGELFDYLTKHSVLSERKTRQIMRQLLEAVAFIHSKGIIHRDLKPENILLDDKFNVKITDFGFARVIGPNEKLYELCGTPGYLAPELLRASMHENVEGYDKLVDMWACGVIMYTLLVGFPPFWHRKQLIMMRTIMEGKYEFCSPEWDGITDHPKNLIRKLLVVDPKKRLTAEEALEDEYFRIAGPRRASFNARKTFERACLVVRAMDQNPPEAISDR